MKAVADLAKDMATAADELHNEFDAEANRVEEAAGSTLRAQGEKVKKKKKFAEDEKKLLVQAAKARAEREFAEEEFNKCQKKYDDAVEREVESGRSELTPFQKLANCILSPIGIKLFDDEGGKVEAEKMRQLQIQKLEQMSKLRQERSKALQDIADFTTKLAQCKDDQELAESAIGALHSATGGLRELSAVMLNAGQFWKLIQVHCDQLAKEDMQQKMAFISKQPKEMLLEFWKSPTFVEEAVTYYGQWVALDVVCDIYMDKIKETQKDLYSYLTDNPTNEQARENVRVLASRFLNDLADEQKKIQEKEFDSAEEVAKLQAQSTSGK